MEVASRLLLACFALGHLGFSVLWLPIGLAAKVLVSGCQVSYGWMMGVMGLLDACWERMKVWKTRGIDETSSSPSRGSAEETVAIELERKSLRPKPFDYPSFTTDLSSFYVAASSSDGGLSQRGQDLSRINTYLMDGSAELDAFWRDELSVVDVEDATGICSSTSGASIDQGSWSFGTVNFESRMFDEMQSRSNSFLPVHTTDVYSNNSSFLEPVPFLPPLSRSSSISSSSSWSSEPKPTTPTATEFHRNDFEDIEIGDVTITSNSTITLTSHSIEAVPVDWETALAWINAACEVEPSSVVSPPPVVVVSEPDQEPVYKPGYAWFEEDCVPVDQTGLGPFTVFNVTYDPLDQLYHYFADLDVVDEEDEEEEEEEEAMEEKVVVPSWGSSASAWDATEDEEGYDQFGAMPEWMEGGEDPFSVA